MWGTSLDFLAALTALVPPPAKLAKTSMLTRVCDTHNFSLQEANTESLASGVGMRFRSFEWFEGSEGFLGLPHARGSIAGTRICSIARPCALPKRLFTACLFVVY